MSVRAHHHVHVTVRQAGQDAIAARGTGATRQQLQRDRRQAAQRQPPAGAPEAAGAVQRPQQLAEAQVVLLGQHLGGRHEGGLAAAADHRQHRHERHHRLARAHLALQQPVHRPRPPQVGQNLIHGAALGGGQGEGQTLPEALQQRPVRLVGDALAGELAQALAVDQHHLHPQQLVEHQPVPPPGHLREGLRVVDQAQRLVAPAQSVVRQHLGGHRIGDAAPLAASQCLGDHVGDLPGADGRLGRERIDGEDGPGPVTDQVHHRVRHLQRVPEHLQAPVQHRPHALAELLGAPRLVEEDTAQPGALAVAHQHLDARPPIASRDGPHPLDGGQDHGVLADLELTHGGLAAAIQVAPRVVGEQVPEMLHTEIDQGLHPAPAGTFEALRPDPGQVPPSQRGGRLNHRSSAPPGSGAYSTPK